MKKPHVLIGLLAALGTAIGVLVAVVGMPYGRLNYTAFAGLYHNGGTPVGTSGFHVALDCDPSTGAIDDDCFYLAGTTAIDISFTVGNESGSAATIGSFDFVIRGDNQGDFGAPVIGAGMDANPDADNGTGAEPNTLTVAGANGNWACSPPSPKADQGTDATKTYSFLSCFNDDLLNAIPLANGSHVRVALLHLDSTTATAGDVDNLTAGTNGSGLPEMIVGAVGTPADNTVHVTDNGGVELVACPDNIAIGTPCFGAKVTIVAPSTNTPAPPTSTGVPATATKTATPVPPDPAMYKDPVEPASEEDGDNLSNLYLCVPDSDISNDPDCDGPGEGSLEVIEWVRNISTEDFDGDTDPDGLGAYEFQVKFDHKVIAFVNPEDIIFSPGGAGASRGPATCTFSLEGENDIRFGCTTTGPTPDGPNGPGPFQLARLTLIPENDLLNIISPGNDNGIVTVLLDENCELSTVFGHPVDSSINGGILPICADLAVTVRILEGDVDLDCDVDAADAQAEAYRYGSSFGNLHYSKWYDLEPWFKDLDIDIKDLQKVFGRVGSTCQDAIPDQPNQPPPAPLFPGV